MVPVAAGTGPVGGAAARGGYGSIFFMVFLFAALGTVVFGVGATTGFSVPAIRSVLGFAERHEPIEAQTWGEVRFVHTTTRIRAERNTASAIVGMLQPGDSVRVDFGAEDWLAVFPVAETARDLEHALGFVYAPLLKAEPTGGSGGAAGT